MTTRATELGSADFWNRLATDPKQLAMEVCTIDLNDLERTMYQHAGLRAWIGTVCENARVEKSKAEWRLEKAQASAFLTAKGANDPQTNKPKNVDTCKAEALLSPEVEAAQQALFGADEKYGALKAMVSALEERKDMIVQIAAKRRQEASA